MQCASCGHKNREGASFCDECGGALVRACPNCSVEVRPAAKFCDECGQALGVSAGQSRRSATPTPAPAPALPASFGSDRYQVQRFIGEGGKKRVYLAHDGRLDSDVAVGVIKTEGLDADGLIRVRREAQAMGRLRDHPNIVTVLDIGEEGDQPYIVMEHMGGGSLEDALRQADNHRLPLDQAFRIGAEICEALEHAHGQRIIHRDLKPANIWLTLDGTAKLGDFGLAVALDRSRLTQTGMMVGTMWYMPPEQALGGDATPASDLYSLGCVLYEAVTGTPPFVTGDTVAIISQHLNSQPIAPSWHNPDCSPALEALILRLLEKDPAQRPASAAEVRQALAAIGTAPPAAAPDEPDSADAASAERSPLYRRTFVGREQELSSLKSAFDDALSGRFGLAMVVGEPGIGKTAVCDQLATYVALKGGRVLIGNCYEEGSLALPYLAFVEAIRTYVLDTDAEVLQKELGTGAPDVSHIVSEIQERIDVEPSPPLQPEEERYRLLHAVSTLLHNAANAQPLCIILEDLHDADHGTLDLLSHLARTLTRTRLLIVGTYRDVEVDRTHPLSSALVELRLGDSFQRITLRGLATDEVEDMLAGIVHQDVTENMSAVAAVIHDQTEGHPLFVQEVVRYGAEAGLIVRQHGRWEAADPETLTAFVPEGLRDVIGKRLSSLSNDCNTLLSVAAIIGRQFLLDTVRAVADMPEEPLFAALEEATKLGILEERSQVGEVRYRFAHAFFRQALYEEMIAPRRIRLHQQVARELEEKYAGRLEEHASELAEHFSESSDSGDLAKAVEYGKMAGERAMGVFAYGEAVRLYERTLQVQEVLDPGDKATRFEMLIALGWALMPAGEAQRAADEVAPKALAMAEALDEPELATDACYMAVWALGYAGGVEAFGEADWDRWVGYYERYAAPDSAAEVWALGCRSWEKQVNGELEETWRLRRRQMDVARKVGDPEALMFSAFDMLAFAWPPQLAVERLQLAEEFASAPRQGVPFPMQGLLLFAVGFALLGVGKRDQGMAPLEELGRLASLTEDPYIVAAHVATEQYLSTLHGDLTAAVETGERLRAHADELGVGNLIRLFTALGSFRALLYLDRADEALSYLVDMESWTSHDALRALGLAYAGRHAEAEREVRKIVSAKSISHEDDITDVGTLVALLEAAILVEDRETAQLLAGRLRGLEPWLIGDWGIGSVGRHIGATEALMGHPEEARRLYGQALEVAGDAGSRLEIALTRLEITELLLQHYPDEKGDALQHLDFVTAEFRDMKMGPALERALRAKMDAQGIAYGDVNTSIDSVAAIAQSEQPDLRQHAAPDGTVTLLFTDIVDSTPLNERLGDRRWMELLKEHNVLVREQVSAHDGYEVKTEGDGFMLAFSSARRAVECAIGIQRAFSERNESANEPVLVRAGLHTGEAIQDQGDFYGKHVTLAARIAAQAGGGQIFVSSLLKELTDSAGDIEFDGGKELELKGLTGTQRVYTIGW